MIHEHSNRPLQSIIAAGCRVSQAKKTGAPMHMQPWVYLPPATDDKDAMRSLKSGQGGIPIRSWFRTLESLTIVGVGTAVPHAANPVLYTANALWMSLLVPKNLSAASQAHFLRTGAFCRDHFECVANGQPAFVATATNNKKSI